MPGRMIGDEPMATYFEEEAATSTSVTVIHQWISLVKPAAGFGTLLLPTSDESAATPRPSLESVCVLIVYF